MQSEQSQILALFASRRIDLAQAERLLALVSSRNRFLTLALVTGVVLAVASINPAQYHLGEDLTASLHSTLQSVMGSETFHHLHLFFCRLMGELP